MSNELEKAEEIARKLKLELAKIPPEERSDHLSLRIKEMPEAYRSLVDNIVAATLIYGQPEADHEAPRPQAAVAATPSKSNSFLRAITRRVWVAVLLILLVGIAAAIMHRTDDAHLPSRAEGLSEFRVDQRRHLLVFIHGVRDDGLQTWTNKDTGQSWLDIVANDNRFSEFDIQTYHYSSMLFRSDNLAISDVADQLAFRLSSGQNQNYDRIVFVAHSMGGLVVRNLLLKNSELADKVPLVFFLATPTAGSDIARLVKLIESNSDQSLSYFARLIGFRSNQISAMTSFEESNFLKDQSSAWRRSQLFAQVYSLCAFEGAPTAGTIVVKQASAESLCNGKTIPTGDTHSGIAKPSSKDSIVHTVFASEVERLFQ